MTDVDQEMFEFPSGKRPYVTVEIAAFNDGAMLLDVKATRGLGASAALELLKMACEDLEKVGN